MLGLADTLLRWPQQTGQRPGAAAISTALAFGLSPLVLIWSRTAVSDALLCGLLAISLLLQWRRFAAPETQRWWSAWLVLGLAVLAKGPVAVVLTGLTLLLFSAWRRDLATPWQRLRPLPGLALTAVVSLPWYVLELLVEGSRSGTALVITTCSASQRGQRPPAALVVLWPGDADRRHASHTVASAGARTHSPPAACP